MSPTKFRILLTRMSPVKVLNTCDSFEMNRDVDKGYIAIIVSLPTRKVAILKRWQLPCHLNHSGVSPGDHPLTKRPEDSEYEIDGTQSGIRVSYYHRLSYLISTWSCFVLKSLSLVVFKNKNSATVFCVFFEFIQSTQVV